ncbi:MAG: GNAT family N-acetyltransferase [Kineosporiaceae bacterium]
MDEVVTERLRLRRFGPGDAEAFAEVNADPLVARHLGDGRPIARDRSDELLAAIMRHWDEHGFGLWAADQRDDGRLLGFVGLAIPAFLPAVLPAVEVGWRLRSDVWGRGLATEGGRAAVDHGFGPLGLERIISIIDPENAASVRVAEKLGLRHERDELHPRTGRTLRIYALARPR